MIFAPGSPTRFRPGSGWGPRRTSPPLTQKPGSAPTNHYISAYKPDQQYFQYFDFPGDLEASPIWNAVLTYIQLFEDIFKYLKISSNKLKISSNELKISSNELKISSNELKISSNELKFYCKLGIVHWSHKEVAKLSNWSWFTAFGRSGSKQEVRGSIPGLAATISEIVIFCFQVTIYM